MPSPYKRRPLIWIAPPSRCDVYLLEGTLVGYRVGQQWFIPRRALEEKMDERVERRREEMMALMERVNRRREVLREGLGEFDFEALIDEARERLP